MSIYATRNTDNGVIGNNSKVVSFDSRAAAEAWLFAGHTDGLFPRIAVGQMHRGWRTTNPNGLNYPTPTKIAKLCAPFQPDEIDTQGPDDHHSGNYLSHTPKVDVLVLVDVPGP